MHQLPCLQSNTFILLEANAMKNTWLYFVSKSCFVPPSLVYNMVFGCVNCWPDDGEKLNKFLCWSIRLFDKQLQELRIKNRLQTTVQDLTQELSSTYCASNFENMNHESCIHLSDGTDLVEMVEIMNPISLMKVTSVTYNILDLLPSLAASWWWGLAAVL